MKHLSLLEHLMDSHQLLCGTRFAGAIPEVANSRLAMLGVILALGAEVTTGKCCCHFTRINNP